MTLQQLEYVLALDTHRNFIAASEHCFVTQPTITLQLKKLEEELGIQLFDRSKVPLKPTKTGELIINKARMVINEVTQLKELIHKETESLDGTFKIGIIPTVAPYLIPEFLGSFANKYPQTVLQIEEMQSTNIIKALQQNRLDIGILVTPIEESYLREVPLYKEAFVFYGDKKLFKEKESIEIKDLEELNGLWLLTSGHCFKNQVLNICQSNERKRSIEFLSGSIETLKKLVNKNGGFTLIPELAYTVSEKKNVLEFKGEKPVREVSIVISKTFAKEKLIHVLRTEILSILPNSLDKNKPFNRIKWR